jgi:CMP-N-acetylneuraminic acid synthetase
MEKKPNICVIIPVKAISKRLPGKNLKDLMGKPMMAYPIEAAKGAVGIDRVIVTTESEEIKKIAELYGAEVPFMRPMELTEDAVTSHQVLLHALGELERQGYIPDYIMMLYPTSPLLKRERIEEVVRIATERGSDSVMSGTYDKGHYWTEEEGGWVRVYPKLLANSQWQQPLFKENGAIYMTKTSMLRRQIVADKADVLIMDADENIDVDYPEDFARVETRMRGI